MTKKLQPRKNGISLNRLTDKQQLFVELYLGECNLNASQAALKSGYTAKGAGNKLLAHPLVKAAIEKASSERSKRNNLRADIVLREVASLALSNIQDCLDEDGKFIPPHKLPRDVAAAISSVEWRIVKDPFTGQILSREVANYYFCDKLSSLHMLMRHLGIVEGMNKAETFSRESFIASLLNSTKSEGSKPKNILDAESIERLADDDELETTTEHLD